VSPADLAAFRRDGAIRLAGLMADRLAGLLELRAEGPGTRLTLHGLTAQLAPVIAAAQALIGDGARPVRAVLFDKTADDNWALAWHQDRTIVVKDRREVPGFGPWSRKQGLLHVAPPFDLLACMATLRIHIDPCGQDNAPLKVALGSHRIGPVPARDATALASAHPHLLCLAEPGDVWAYATPILHSSDRSAAPRRRRVLQVDYSADTLPGGLEFAEAEA